MDDLIFRPARPGDVTPAVELLHQSHGEFGTALFGLGDPALERRILAGLFVRRGSRFAYEWGEVAEMAGQVAALLLALPGDAMLRLNLGVFRQAGRIYGARRTLSFIRRALPMAAFKEVERGELMVGNVAVMPELRGRGIGRRLLERAEDQARRLGVKRLTLTVDVDNDGARRLYVSAGYTHDRLFLTPRLMPLLHTHGVERMIKVI